MGKNKKTPAKFNTSVIEKVFIEKNINIPFEEFIDALIIEENIVKEKEEIKLKEENSKIYVSVENIYPKLDSNTTIEEHFDSIVDEGDWYDFFVDDDLPDEGADGNEYYMVGEKLYEVELHCEAEWIGDWSVRANVPSDVSVTKIKEIKKFEILEKNKNSITIKIK